MHWPNPACARLIDAMVRADGGPGPFIHGVRLSIPDCADLVQARQVAANTIARALWDYALARPEGVPPFIRFLGNRWIDPANDPGDLTRNWATSVIAHYQGGPR